MAALRCLAGNGDRLRRCVLARWSSRGVDLVQQSSDVANDERPTVALGSLASAECRRRARLGVEAVRLELAREETTP
jgi:hypothetical protein